MMHEQVLLAMLPEEGLKIELAQYEVRVDGLPASCVQDGGAAAELPYSYKSNSAISFISIEIDR